MLYLKKSHFDQPLFVDDDREDRRRAINFVTAFAAAVKLHLRKERDIRRDLEEVGVQLSIQDIANIQNASHMPLFCQDILSNYLAKQFNSGKLTDYQLGTINTTALAGKFLDYIMVLAMEVILKPLTFYLSFSHER